MILFSAAPPDDVADISSSWSSMLALMVCYLIVLLLAAIPLIWRAVFRHGPIPTQSDIHLVQQRMLPGGVITLLAMALILIPILTAQLVGGFQKNPSTGDPAEISNRETLAMLVAFPLQFFCLAAFQMFFSIWSAQAVGMTRGSYQRAFWIWLVVTPVVFIIFQITLSFFSDADVHPIAKKLSQLDVLGKIVLSLQPVLFAPLMEEWFFRGILLKWQLQQDSSNSNAETIPYAVEIIFLIAFVFGALCDQKAGMVGMIAGVYIVMQLLSRSSWFVRKCKLLNSGWVKIIFANSILFAAIHATVWPTPIPLFFLSLALGWAALRCQGFWVAFLIHALFNSVSTVMLFFSKLY
ncbi:CPBP family intramembrane metalloprotease [Telmatocola sphagniphila]|uniref:CPBP family intramembrane metalloprotease n=1 Tax=Telmatocola sphagniphila TaxID=1123043 RepID=A0A8E6B8B3_9BACT|nr:CPBP family intramembrane glutamic endopeptidase [Telmatocola sphagniphila]QVL33344.1 CPBP family intramembrane metalloprotease [Telmatocola sphagniphila]